MTVALYAGSFDPITLGHIDIIKKSTKMFEKVIIGVTYNTEKQSFLQIYDRVELIKGSVKDIERVEVCSYNGLTVDFAKKYNAKVLIRGIRNSIDYEYEKQLAEINADLAPEIVTIFLASDPEYNHISSTAVRELIANKCDISKYVPQNIVDYFSKK